MRTLLFRSLPIVVLLGLLFLGSGAALAALSPRASAPPVALHTQRRPTAPAPALTVTRLAFIPQAVLATCDAKSTPKDCADAIVAPGNRLFQIFLLIFIEAGSAAAVITIVMTIVGGIIGLGTGEPRAVSHVMYKAVGITILVMIMVLAPQGLGMIFSGSSVQFQLPNIQQLIPLGN